MISRSHMPISHQSHREDIADILNTHGRSGKRHRTLPRTLPICPGKTIIFRKNIFRNLLAPHYRTRRHLTYPWRDRKGRLLPCVYDPNPQTTDDQKQHKAYENRYRSRKTHILKKYRDIAWGRQDILGALLYSHFDKSRTFQKDFRIWMRFGMLEGKNTGGVL